MSAEISDMSAFTSKWVRLAPNGTNSRLFQIRFPYILARKAKMYWNLVWKSLRFVSLWSNLASFVHKSDIHDTSFNRKYQWNQILVLGTQSQRCSNDQQIIIFNLISILINSKQYSFIVYYVYGTMNTKRTCWCQGCAK